MSPGPLAGVRVVDLSRLVAGNHLTLVLGDFGAEVVKVEQPDRGDPLRDWQVEGSAIWWEVYSRNKKSLTLDLKTSRGRELALALARGADILVENFKPGTLESLGLGPSILLEENPSLVVARISGWGQTGAYATRPGFGTLVEAMSGFAALNGFADREPVLPPLSLADMVAGLYGATSAMMALRHAETTGHGQTIDISLLESLFSILGPQAARYQLTQAVPERTGSRSHTAAPRNVYETSDGQWIAISASMQVMAQRLFRALGREDLISDPRFRTNTERLQHVEELDAVVQACIAERTLAENLDLFVREGITAGPVYTIADLIDDPHVRSRDMLVQPQFDEDRTGVPMHQVVPRLGVTPGGIRGPAPALGEHAHAVLGELGLDDQAIAKLESEGVI